MPRFHPAERTFMMVIAAFAVACLVLGLWKGVTFDPTGMLAPAVFSFAFIMLGQYYRVIRDGERIALVAIIVGLFAPWSFVASIYNILLLPRPMPAIDPFLVRLDAMLGFSWPAFCAWIAQYPLLADVTREVYKLTLLQLLFTLMFLGLAADRPRLHTAALALIVASLVTVFFWALFPSSGPTAYWTLDPDVERALRPVANTAYGAELTRQLSEGLHDVSQIKAKGMIAFPSFHTVMGLMTLVAAWPYRFPRYLLLAINAILLPGILAHGGHHLVDVFAGVGVTIASWFLAVRIYQAQEAHELGRTGQVKSPVQISAS